MRTPRTQAEHRPAGCGRRARRILVLNPGSTSTKLAVFAGARLVFQETAAHAAAGRRARRVADQLPARLALVRRCLIAHGESGTRVEAVIGRGGLLRPIPGGVYRVNAAMLADLRSGRHGEHASNLGGLLADRLARAAGCPAWIADPVVVDELEPAARLTGLPGIRRRSIFHALNQKAVARDTARRLGKPYRRCRLIVAHLGGGISVGAHRGGRVVDVNNALDGDGPFAPERAGSLPAGQLAALCFARGQTLAGIRRALAGRGGLAAHRGSSSFPALKQAMRRGDARARLLFAALAGRVAQEIAKHGATLAGRVDRIVLTGGLARDQSFARAVAVRVRFLAPVRVVPGERELEALAEAARAVLDGRARAREYPS